MDDVKFPDVGGAVVREVCLNVTEHRDDGKSYEALVRQVVEKFFPESCSAQDVRYGTLERNYFSFSFWIDIIRQENKKGVYVKIPKSRIERAVFGEVREEDRSLAAEEVKSLECLSQYWRAEDLRVHFVKLLGFFREHNAIVTQRVYGDFLYTRLRAWDMMARIKRNGTPAYEVMERIGAALARFHKSFYRQSAFSMDALSGKVKHYGTMLHLPRKCPEYYEAILEKLQTAGLQGSPVSCTRTLKGLDVRNLLVDDTLSVYALDPGKLKEDVAEADIARFIATCRILYWGHPLFAFHFSLHPSCEERFLRGYYGALPAPLKLLSVLMVKELLKHWHTAYIAVSLKRWPETVKRLCERTYVDPFFKKQISRELGKHGA